VDPGDVSPEQLTRDLNALSNIQQLHPRSPRHLWQLVKILFGVRIPYARCCPGHASPFEAFSHAFFARSSICVWHASRGFGGKSFLLALLSITEQTLLAASVALLGGSLEQSKRVLSYLTGADPNAKGKFWNAPLAPRWLQSGDPTQTETRLINGGWLKALAASHKSARGPHPQRLRLDECDEMELGIFDSAMGQTMAYAGVPAQTVCSSTHQYPDGTMTEILKRADEKGWPVFRWCYRESMAPPAGWLDPLEIERKRNEVTSLMWETEYELQEPSVEGRAIDVDAVRDLFDERLGVYPGTPGKQIVRIKPGGDREFYHGADWAKAKDWSVLHSMWTNPKGPDVLAAWCRVGRIPWPQIIKLFNDRVERYGGPSCHDATGVGEVCADYLEIDSEGVDFRLKKQRDEMLSNYIAAIERREMRYPKIAALETEHRYATWADVYGSGHLPDSISAGALAQRAKMLEVGHELLVGRA
jgi:hypothetical protein